MNAQTSSKVQSVDQSSFEREVLQSPVPVVVDLWAAWCGPCRMMSPVIDELSAEFAGRARVVKVNVDENPALAGQFGIRSIPTFLYFKNGQLAGKQVGMAPKAALAQELSNLL